MVSALSRLVRKPVNAPCDGLVLYPDMGMVTLPIVFCLGNRINQPDDPIELVQVTLV